MKEWWVHPPSREPDKWFIYDLKQLDDKLMAYWDAIDKNWVIVRHGDTGDHEIAHYNYLDNRVFESLHEGDLRRKKPQDWDEYISNYNNKIKREKLNNKHEENMEFSRRVYVDGGVREHKTQF